MYPLNLDDAARRAFDAALVSSHSIRVRVNVLTLEHDPVGSLTGFVLEGGVTVDSTAEVSRALNLTAHDPDGSLAFDSDSPNNGAIYADRMIEVVYGVKTAAGWVDVPVFCGPVTGFKRTGPRVVIEAQGKERLAMGAAWRTRSYPKGTKVVAAIGDLLRGEGETLLSLGNSSARLGAKVNVVRSTVPWQLAKKLAAQADLQLYYDGAGRARLRQDPETSLYTFRVAPTGGSVLTVPEVTYATGTVRNAVQWRGKLPKGKKEKGKQKTVVGTAVAPTGHPLSPQRLGRNGQPRYIAEFVSGGTVPSQREAQQRAKAKLNRLLDQTLTVTFDALVVPHLDAGDKVTVDAGDWSASFVLPSFTIPLSASGTMSVGYTKRQGQPNRKAIR